MRITAPFARSSSGRSSLAQPLRPGQFPVPVPRTVQISELFEIIEGTRSRSVFEDWAFRGTVAHVTKLLLTGAHTALRSYLCNRKMRFDKNCPEISAVWNSPPTPMQRAKKIARVTKGWCVGSGKVLGLAKRGLRAIAGQRFVALHR